VPPQLSIVVPLYNEAENVLPLAREIAESLKNQSASWELILVDDASTDETWARIREARRQDPRVRGLRHARNAGQSAALWTGIQSSQAPLIATLDGDLQNDPADLPKLLEKANEFDFVCGVRTKRKDDFVRRASSKVARRARKLALGVDFADTGCAFRVFKREVLTGLFPFNGLHRFLPVLVHGGGWKTLEVPINHRPRVAGVSKYGLWNRLGRGLLDLFAIAWHQRRRVNPIPFDEDKE
jgi:dolichol-phosphate mannosyltransferase